MIKPEPVTLLSKGWLSEQPEPFRDRLLSAARWKTLARGETLYSVGDDPNAMFGLEEGFLDLAIPIAADEEVVIHRAPPGFWIGDSALLADSPRTLSLTAATPARVLALPAAAIRRLLADHPQDWPGFAALAHRNGTMAIQALGEVLALPPRARFARLLLRIADAEGRVRATQEELGRLAGMSRAAFRRAFADLIAAGVVEMEYAGLVILDRTALQAEADRR